MVVLKIDITYQLDCSEPPLYPVLQYIERWSIVSEGRCFAAMVLAGDTRDICSICTRRMRDLTVVTSNNE